MSDFSIKREENQILYSRDTLKRLASDIKCIKKNPLNDQGIYYEHDQENILKGYALIIGPPDTPYEYGHYFFDFDFPGNYPHSPPVVTFFNWGDNIRYNPNLYRNGKVCLSMLNTWKGEGWTSCQTITTILLTLCTVLNEYPLCNEPGYTMERKDEVNNYNKIIEYKNVELAFIRCYQQLNIVIPDKYSPFLEFVKENVEKNWKNIEKKINCKRSIIPSNTRINSQYNMTIDVNWDKLNDVFILLKNKIENV